MLSFFASSNNSNSRQHSKIKILERARFENMNYGKLTQDIFERTVHKTIQNNSILYKNHFSGTGLGADCAILPLNNDKKDALLVTGQALAYGNDQYSAVRAMIAALNHVAVMGGVSADRTNSAEFIFMVPEKLREIKVRRMIEQAAIKAQEMGVLIASVQTQVLPMVNETVVTCNVCGARVSDSENDNISINNSHKTDTKSKDCGIIGRNGNMSDNVCDVVMTKWIGLEGTSLIARANGEKLKERYPEDLVETAQGFDKYLSVLEEAATAEKSGICAMQVVREGGIFGALWELAEHNDVGLVIDLKSIPVRQETIEVCEYFDINPYELTGGGSLLITAPNGARIVEKLAHQGISSAVIGYTTFGNDRIIRQDGECRYLEPARNDEIFKVFDKNRQDIF